MHRYLIVDVFTDTPLHDNLVAAFLDAADLPADLMQRLARAQPVGDHVHAAAGERR
ncbi:hypothetical protein ACIA5G_52550 [Amycolatopsis sp. NPDC051758]|uniref:hypothetical protein n=1 Tax=Amycolatopsis sp. NPDC051758 TaxID=3363935 RepID=UPI00379C32CA